MNHKYFSIQNFPDDVYNAVGQIIKSAQEWERQYKELASMLNIPIKKIGNSCLNKLNVSLKKLDLISEKDFQNLKKVIKLRNYMNHEFFLKDFSDTLNDYDRHIKKLETCLNLTQFLIYEATDIIDNKIDILKGDDNSIRPTIFDNIIRN